jgi:hypothetical protein
MLEKQPSPQPKRARSGRQTAQQKLAAYRKVLQDMHDLLLTEESKLQEIVRDEQRVPTLKNSLSTILAWIKKVENNEKIINSFTNVLGKEIEMFKENIENAIFYLNVVLDVLEKEKQALEKNQVESFADWRIQVYRKLKECRKCIYQALLLFK